MTAAASQRIDKWLFFARVVKSRSLAQKLVQGGAIRINSAKIDQPSYPVKPGDGLTIKLERHVLVYRVLLPGVRRGPAEEARTLYEDLTPPPPDRTIELAAPAAREPGSGRPTKRERREIDKWMGDPE